MWRPTLSLLLLSLFAVTAFAQKFEAFGGYQFTHLQPAFNANGWNVAVTGNFKHVLGITADFSGAYGDSLHVHTYTGGPVLTARLPVVQPFVHALFGGITLSGTGSGSRSDSGFAMLLGGGLDIGMRRGLAVRLFQADWVSTRFSGETFNRNVRVSAGLVLKF